MRWLVLLALTGCFRSRDVETPGSVHVVEEVAGPPHTVALNVTESYGTLHIDATRLLFCYRETRQYIEHRDEVDGGPSLGGGILGALVSVGTAAAVDAGAETQLEDRTLSVQKRDCSIPADGATIAVELPSGAVVRARTDARGLTHIQIPATEPASGIAIVHAANWSVRVAYSR